MLKCLCISFKEFFMFEKELDINKIKEIRTRTLVYFGVGAIKKIEEIIENF